jgi:hypothetical protein
LAGLMSAQIRHGGLCASGGMDNRLLLPRRSRRPPRLRVRGASWGTVRPGGDPLSGTMGANKVDDRAGEPSLFGGPGEVVRS